ncbi:MAG: amidohydrolase [Clostridia bacterium]|nr:amidohydrolase [Clostridia bacterium]
MSVTRMLELVEEMKYQLVHDRRDIHSRPETGWLEMRTSAIIAKRLTELGYEVLTGSKAIDPDSRLGLPDAETLERHARDVQTQPMTPLNYLTDEMKAGMTGVIGILRCGPGPVLALRFDIDALPMEERHDDDHRPYREDYFSRNPGMMHACGHDGHVAIGLGVAKVLMALRDELHGTVKLIFQPAEEGARGARAVTAAGHLDDVDFFIGSHVAPDDTLDDGDVTCGTYGSLATTKLDVVFRGLAAHAGGFPENGKNALLAACNATLALHAIPRHSQGQSRVNVGSLISRGGRNVIPDCATLQLEVRGETTQINQYMTQQAEHILKGAAQMQDCTVEIHKVGEAEGQASDLALIQRIADVVRRDLPFLTLSSEQNAKNWGSEDISIMMNRVQSHGGLATYMRVMTTMPSAQHTVGFDFDERVLPHSVMVFSAAALDILSGKEDAQA